MTDAPLSRPSNPDTLEHLRDVLLPKAREMSAPQRGRLVEWKNEADAAWSSVFSAIEAAVEREKGMREALAAIVDREPHLYSEANINWMVGLARRAILQGAQQP